MNGLKNGMGQQGPAEEGRCVSVACTSSKQTFTTPPACHTHFVCEMPDFL
jgi:hypothetical protein